MGMTMTEKILAQHAGRDAVQAGDLLVAQVDLVLANDITGPPAIAEFEKIGRPVFDKDKIALVPDHFSPCKDIKSATMCKRMRDFARQHEITNYFEVGRWVSSMRFYLTAVLLLPVSHYWRRFSYLYLWRSERTQHRHGSNRYWCGYGQRHYLVQGACHDQSRADR